MKFIYITPFVDEDFYIDVKRGMNDAAELLSVSTVFTGTHNADYDVLISMVKKAVDEQYDGIALNMAHPTIFKEVALLARDKGIPVVSFNIDSPQTPRLAGVCQNFYKAGKILGDIASIKLKEKSHVLITMHDDGVSALEERALGITHALEPKNITFERLITGNTPELAKKSILQSLSESVSAILCTGQSDTHGAGLAAKALSDKKLYIAGFDVCTEIRDMIKQGIIDCTIDQQPYIQGFYPLLMMYQYKKHGVIPFDIDTGCNIIK